MKTQSRNAPRLQTLLERSEKWLEGAPTLPEIKRALSAIVARVASEELVDDVDTRDTCDALTEEYVNRGGDLSDLSTLPDLQTISSASGERLTPVTPAGLDYGNLYPNDAPTTPLSSEEKRLRLETLRASITRPGGF